MLERILIAPDKFKGSLSSGELARHIERGLKRAGPKVQTRSFPVADGGEGTVDALVTATRGKIRKVDAFDPLMRKINSFYGILGDGRTAVVEMAAASGLQLLKKEERDPGESTTYGTGQLIGYALDEGVERIIVGVGGSATSDGGAGMAEALGARFTDKFGNQVARGGKHLKDIVHIDTQSLHPGIKKTEIVVACDVDVPFYGEKGSARVFARQKGADGQMVNELDRGLAHFAEIIRKDTGMDISNVIGAGAAGGLAGGLAAFLGGRLVPGIQILQEFTSLEKEIEWSQLVITGEGKADDQTAYGKTPAGLAQIASRLNKPVVLITGALGDGYETLYEHGIHAVIPITERPATLEESMQNAGTLVENAAERLFRIIMLADRYNSPHS